VGGILCPFFAPKAGVMADLSVGGQKFTYTSFDDVVNDK